MKRGRGRVRRHTSICVLVVFYAASRAASLHAQGADPIAEAKRLRDAHEYADAARALIPYLSKYPNDASVHWFRAQLLSWAGDRNGARTEYERTLTLTPIKTPAADSLSRYIADLSPSWASASAKGHSDDQTLHGTVFGIEAGHYVTSSIAMRADATVAGYTAPDEIVLHHTSVTNAQLAVTGSATNLSFGAGAGGERASLAGTTIAIGDAWIAMHLSRELTAALSVARSGYHYTIESMDTAIVVNASEASIGREPIRGVAGKLAFRNEGFSDANNVRVVYGWILLPLAVGARVGYAGEYRNAAESRWNGARFDPYYTPANVRIHSAIGEWSWRDFRHALQVNGAIGLSARENAPYLLNASGKQHGFTERSFTPYNIAATGSTRITYRTSLNAGIEYHRTAFYQATSAQLGGTLLLR